MQSLSAIIITCLYRPPSTNTIIHDLICDFISKLCESINSTIIVGDFNLSLFNWITISYPNYPSCYLKFYNTLIKNSLSQLITFPTRSNNLLDLLLTNSPMLISNINVFPEFGNGKYSDHISFSFSLLIHKTSINVNHNGLNFR